MLNTHVPAALSLRFYPSMFYYVQYFNSKVCVCVCDLQMEHTGQSCASSDPEDCEAWEDRKYPGDVTSPNFKIKFQPKDCKKDLLL